MMERGRVVPLENWTIGNKKELQCRIKERYIFSSEMTTKYNGSLEIHPLK
jgi:hypothetical protein